MHVQEQEQAVANQADAIRLLTKHAGELSLELEDAKAQIKQHSKEAAQRSKDALNPRSALEKENAKVPVNFFNRAPQNEAEGTTPSTVTVDDLMDAQMQVFKTGTMLPISGSTI